MTNHPGRHATTWLREEYRGRDAELINSKVIGELGAVDPVTVNRWARTYDDFPEAAKEVWTGRRPTRYYVASEVVWWLLHRQPGDQTVAQREARLRAVAADYDAAITELETRLEPMRGVRDQLRAVLDEADTIGP